MWRHPLRVSAAAGLVATSAVAAGQGEASRLQIVVSVFNRAGAAQATVLDAEKMTTKIYEQVGLRIVWKNCRTHSEPELDRCEPATDRSQLVLNIEHRSRALVADALGVSFLGDDGWGTFWTSSMIASL